MGRDFEAEVHALRSVQAGDACPSCGGKLGLYRGIEAGHIFLLGTHYTQQMGATFIDDAGTNRPIVMGSYGIGISRLVAAAVEQHNDEMGVRWPMSIAPYQVHIVQIGSTEAVVEAVAKLERDLESAGLEVLIDDRDDRPGKKFKDADLIGIPLRVTVGDRALAQGQVEFKPRSEADPKKAQLVAMSEIAEVLKQEVQRGLEGDREVTA
jgi:prolyl-tRNA synthetase